MPVLYKGHLCTVWCHTDVSSVMSYWCQQLCLYIWSYMLFVSKYGACEVRLSEIRRLSPYMEGCVGYLHIWRFNLQRVYGYLTTSHMTWRWVRVFVTATPRFPVEICTISRRPERKLLVNWPPHQRVKGHQGLSLVNGLVSATPYGF